MPADRWTALTVATNSDIENSLTRPDLQQWLGLLYCSGAVLVSCIQSAQDGGAVSDLCYVSEPPKAS